ncbi:hypothetical protein L9F63_006136, partial [Diploptera punctata]
NIEDLQDNYVKKSLMGLLKLPGGDGHRSSPQPTHLLVRSTNSSLLDSSWPTLPKKYPLNSYKIIIRKKSPTCNTKLPHVFNNQLLESKAYRLPSCFHIRSFQHKIEAMAITPTWLSIKNPNTFYSKCEYWERDSNRKHPVLQVGGCA